MSGTHANHEGVKPRHAHEPHYLPVEHDQPDSWHRHTREEGAPQSEHGAIAHPGILAAWFVGIVVSVVGTVWIVAVYFESYTTKLRQKKIEVTTLSTEYRQMKSSAESELHSVGWVDPATNTVRIPIDEAMARLVEKYKAMPRDGAAASPR